MLSHDTIQSFHLQLQILLQFVLILFALPLQSLYLNQLVLSHRNQFIHLLHYCLLNNIPYHP
jgi:hypothetical protein